MIKIFRRIRKNLLIINLPTSKLGKLRKYMLYGVGEIILVVIGILIALQINNWNEDRKLNIKEKALYKKLIADLNSEELALIDQIEYTKRHQDDHYALYNKVKGEHNKDAVMSNNFLQLTITHHPKIKVIYTERLIEISKENVRDFIIKYISMESVTNQAIEDYNDYKIKSVRPFIERNGLYNIESIFNDERYSYPAGEHKHIELINDEKLQVHFGSDELNSILVELRLHLAWVIQNLDALKVFNQELAKELETKLRSTIDF